MATDQSIVDYILEQISGAGRVHAKKMFGEYGVYCDDKNSGTQFRCKSSDEIVQMPSSLM